MKYSPLLKHYSLICTILGALLSIFGALSFAVALYHLILSTDANWSRNLRMLSTQPRLLFLGLLLIGVSQFLSHVSNDRRLPIPQPRLQ